MNLELLAICLTVGVFVLLGLLILAVIAYRICDKKLDQYIDNNIDLHNDNEQLRKDFAARGTEMTRLQKDNADLQHKVSLNHRDVQRGRSFQEVMDWMYNPETPLEKVGIFGDFVRHKGLGSALDFFHHGAVLTPEQRISRGLEARQAQTGIRVFPQPC